MILNINSIRKRYKEFKNLNRFFGYKLIIVSLLFFIISTLLSSCEKEYLTRNPLDQISNPDYWTRPADLMLYVNQFYNSFPTFSSWHPNYLYEDGNSDNMAPLSDPTARDHDRIAGMYNINSENGNWSSRYNSIRDVNFMIVNAGKKGATDTEEGKRYLGEGRFFRAYFYFQLVKDYGAVPWIGKPLNTDSEELYKPRTPRNQVIDSILVDLDYAIEHLPSKNNTGGNRLNKESALLFKSRVALFEGTWEKYHQGTVFGVDGANGQNYLQIAAQAAKALIDLGTADLYTGEGDPDSNYRSLFNQDNLSDFEIEVFLWQDYSADQGTGHNVQRRMPRHGGGTGLTKALVEAFLADDGKPIAVSDRYQGDETLTDVVANRDPRLDIILKVPGDLLWIESNGTEIRWEKPMLQSGGVLRSTTGYELHKGGVQTKPIPGQFLSETAAVIFRYPEALLNYAEAKAELGEITQQDLDMSINNIRDRVDMPHLMLDAITTDPNWEFPDLSPVINEVRRERRVEYVCEGHRLHDILRWAAADEVIKNVRPLGYKFSQDQFPNMVVGEDIYLNSEGYIEPFQDKYPNGLGFNLDRDYLLPIPPTEITLNEQITQNPNW